MKNIVFDKQWFEKYQSRMLWLLNAPLIKYWFRWVMCIENRDFINQITPSSYSFGARYIDNKKRIEIKTDFRSHDKYSKRLYYAFRPFWYLLHFFDWAMLDRVEELTHLSFGFSTLTVFPDAGSTTNDGEVQMGTGATWAIVQGAATGDATTQSGGGDGSTACVICGSWKISSSSWFVYRGFTLFDTSGLTSGAVISACTYSLCTSTAVAISNDDAGNIDIITTTPASNTALVITDYPQVGTTLQATSLAGSSWSASDGTYNDFVFNSTGRGNISKTGISKFGVRQSNDTSNTQPAGKNRFTCYLSANTGTTKDPKMVITYTIPVTSFPTKLLLMGTGKS